MFRKYVRILEKYIDKHVFLFYTNHKKQNNCSENTFGGLCRRKKMRKDYKVADTRKQKAKQRILLLLITTLLITVGSIVFGSSFSAARESSEEFPKEYQYYKSITIQEGDTLWSVAQEYQTEYKSVEESMKE